MPLVAVRALAIGVGVIVRYSDINGGISVINTNLSLAYWVNKEKRDSNACDHH